MTTYNGDQITSTTTHPYSLGDAGDASLFRIFRGVWTHTGTDLVADGTDDIDILSIPAGWCVISGCLSMVDLFATNMVVDVGISTNVDAFMDGVTLTSAAGFGWGGGILAANNDTTDWVINTTAATTITVTTVSSSGAQSEGGKLILSCAAIYSL